MWTNSSQCLSFLLNSSFEKPVLMFSGSNFMKLKGQMKPPKMGHIPAVDDVGIWQFVLGDRMVPVPVAHVMAREKK
jgi:hypothetical protein